MDAGVHPVSARCSSTPLVPLADGRTMVATGEACRRFGCTPDNLADWVRRSAAEETFPRVDRPVRAGRLWWYVLEQLTEAEAWTAEASSGRRRAGVSTSGA